MIITYRYVKIAKHLQPVALIQAQQSDIKLHICIIIFLCVLIIENKKEWNECLYTYEHYYLHRSTLTLLLLLIKKNS